MRTNRACYCKHFFFKTLIVKREVKIFRRQLKILLISNNKCLYFTDLSFIFLLLGVTISPRQEERKYYRTQRHHHKDKKILW